jgi:Phytanoyl-CoA dioxygenase (PhyH)
MAAMISVTQRNAWEDAGFLKLSGFLSPAEVDDLREWVADIGTWPADGGQWMHHFEQTAGGVRPARTEYLIADHDGLRQLLTTGKVPAAAGELIGEPVLLYKEKINYKYPGGGGYAAHQDAPAYEFVKSHITCSIAVDAATPENGCLFFAAGRHREGLLHLDQNGCIAPDFAGTLNWVPVPMQPGDALFFSSYAPHKSPPNATEQPRRTLYLTYNAQAEGDLREAYYADKRQALAAEQHAGGGKLRISKIGHFDGRPVERA